MEVKSVKAKSDSKKTQSSSAPVFHAEDDLADVKLQVNKFLSTVRNTIVSFPKSFLYL